MYWSPWCTPIGCCCWSRGMSPIRSMLSCSGSTLTHKMLCEMNKLFTVIELSWNNFLIYDQDYIGVMVCGWALRKLADMIVRDFQATRASFLLNFLNPNTTDSFSCILCYCFLYQVHGIQGTLCLVAVISSLWPLALKSGVFVTMHRNKRMLQCCWVPSSALTPLQTYSLI